MKMTVAQAKSSWRKMLHKLENNQMNFDAVTLLLVLIRMLLIPHYENFTKSPRSSISIINIYLIPLLGHLTVPKVTFALVQASVYRMIEAGLAAETIRKRIQCGHFFFELLIKNSLATFNPFKGVNKPTVNNIRDYVLPDFMRLPYIKILHSESNVFADALLFMLFLTLRVKETIEIKVVDISADLTVLTLNDTKSNARQFVQLNSQAQEIVRRRIALTNNEYLFPSPKKLDSHIASPRGCFERVKKRMADKGFDISGMWIYDNRRLSLSVASEVSNGNTFLLAGMARHSSPEVLKRYVHCTNQAVSELSEATAKALLTPITSKNTKEKES